MIVIIERAIEAARNEARRRAVRRHGERWLRAEAAARRPAADLCLRRAFRSMPRPAPAAGFTERVLAQVLPWLPQPRDPFARVSVRWAIATAFVLFGSAFAVLPQVFTALGGELRAGTVIQVAQRVPVVLSETLTGVIGLWPLASALGQAVAAATFSPWFLTALVTLTFTAVATMKVVTDLLVRQKGFTHVDLV
jgi:hypothetical protein